MQTIPCQPSNPRYTIDVTLSDVGYRMAFEYNERDATWYFSLRLADDTSVVEGVAVVLGWPLLYGAQRVGRPPGQLYAIDTSDKDLPPGVDELGSRVQLVYVLQSELLS